MDRLKDDPVQYIVNAIEISRDMETVDIEGNPDPEGLFYEKDTRHGRFRYPAHDTIVGVCLTKYGEFSEGELRIFRHFIKPDDVVVSAGSNIGALIVPLSRMCRKVYTAEPNPMIRQLLLANLQMNDCSNVEVFAGALGPTRGTVRFPDIPASHHGNFGSLQVGSGELEVQMTTIDHFVGKADFIHLDVERYEEEVLRGAANAITSCRPVLYVESDGDICNRKGMFSEIESHGYEVLLHFALLYDRDNFAGDPVNVWMSTDGKQIGSPMALCLPY